jgi:hypothetical protein
VYRARDPVINRLVALKTITTGLAEFPDLLERFYQEAQSAGGLQHPNIVTIFDMGDEGGIPYIAMELVDGETLDQLIARRASTAISVKLMYAYQACKAFDYAHKRGIVHRDIKPDNVMLTKDGTVKVVDFGIARVLETSRTQTGMLLGTFAYMSPEQYHGEHADMRSDIWSFGVLLYELLAYERPFKGQTPASLMHSICAVEPAPLSQVLPGCPPALEKILQQTLRKSPADRYQSMEDLLLDLDPLCKSLQSESMASLMDQSKQSAGEGNFAQARDLLRQVLQIDSTYAPARTFLDRVNVELRRIQIRPRVRQHVETGLSLLEHGKTLEAKAEAEMALQLDAAFEPAQQLLERAEEEIKRAQQIAEWLEASRRRLVEGNPEEAEELINNVLMLAPEHEQANALRLQVLEQKAELQRRARFAEQMKAARSLWTQQNYEDCIRLLTDLQKEFPSEDEIPGLLESAREDQASQQRLQGLAEARSLLANQCYDECLALLEELAKLFPNDEEGPRLKQKVLEDRAKRRKSDALAQARALLDARQFKECLSLLDSLRTEFPEDAEIQKLEKKTAEDQRKQRFLQALDDARGLLNARRYDDCLSFLSLLEKEFPEDAEIRRLRTKAQEDQRKQRLFQAMEEARSLFNAQRYDDCISFLSVLEKEFPQDSELRKLQTKAQEDQRKQRLLRAMEEARTLFNAKRYDDCLVFLNRLRGEFPEEDEIQKLAESAEKEKTEHQRRLALAQARKLLGAKSYEECSTLLLNLDNRFPNDEEIEVLRETLRSEQAEQSKRKTLTEARSLLTSKQHEACLALLTNLQGSYPGDKEIAKLLETVREAQADQNKMLGLTEARKLLTAHRYDESLAILKDLQKKFSNDEEVAKLVDIANEERAEQQKQQMLGEARAHFASQRYQEARGVVEKLNKAYPRDPGIHKLQSLIQQEEEKQATQEKLQRELTIFKNLVAEKKYAEVLSRSEKTPKEFSGNADLARLVEFSRAQQARLEKEAREKKILREVKEHMAAERFEDAYRAAAAGLREFPEWTELTFLRDRADAEQRKIETRQYIEQRVREIKFKINRGKLSEAIDLANETLMTHGPDTDVTQLLKSARIEYQAREKKRKQEEQLQDVRTLLSSGKLDEAARTLRDAVSGKTFEEFDPRVQRVADEIEAAKAAAAAETVADRSKPALSKEYAWLQAPPIPETPISEKERSSAEPTEIAEPQVSQRPPTPQPATTLPPVKLPSEPAREQEPVAAAPVAEPTTEKTQQLDEPRPATFDAPPVPLWRKPAFVAVMALAATALALGGIRVIPRFVRHEANSTVTPPAVEKAPQASMESRQRDALKAADKLVAANDLEGALKTLMEAGAVNGPLTSEIDKRRSAIEESLKDQSLRELRHQEEQLWQEAQDDVAKGRFSQAQKTLGRILALGSGGTRKADAQEYLKRIIPARQHEEALFASAQQNLKKGDAASLQNADGMLGQVIALNGPRKEEAEQLRRDARGKLTGFKVAAGKLDLQLGDFHAARIQANQIQQAGGDPAALLAGIDKAEQARLSQLESQFNQLRQSDDDAAAQQLSSLQKGFQALGDSGGPREDEAKSYISNLPAAIREVHERAAGKRAEAAYQQLVQKAQQALNGGDKATLEASRSALQNIAQGGGSHAGDAQKYVDQINAKLTAMQPPPPPAKPETPSGPSDNDAVMALIKKYSQAYDQRNANALLEIWPNMGKRYAAMKSAFEGASAIRMDVKTESVTFSADGNICTVTAQFTQDYTPQGQKAKSAKGRTIFQFAKVNGTWVITDVQ